MSTSDPPDPNPTGALSAPGETIRDRYRVERVLGRGGMGEVLLAHDILLHRRVAIKRLRSDGAEEATRRSAVLKEARRASQVSDRRIAAIYDVLELGSDVLIVMEYVEGATLRSRMSGPMPLAEFWPLATQCVEAVGAAHAHGVVHRDIKPENLMVTGDGQIKILDFGIARRSESEDGTLPTLATTMTAEAGAPLISGTPQYMAPEAHYGGRIDGRSDIFSLGTVFYELLTAVNPFAGETYQAVLQRVMTQVPPPASEVNPAVGPALSTMLAKMLARDPAHRQGTCGQVAVELEAARTAGAAQVGAPTTRVPAGLPRRMVTARAVAALGLVAVAALIGWGLLHWSSVRALPADRNLAVLAPATPGASEEFGHYALGAIDLLWRRLQMHQAEPGFQIASFTEGRDENVRTAEDARKVLGTSLALLSTLEQRSDVFRARLELWDTVRRRVIATRAVETSVSQPFEFLDRLYRESASMLHLATVPGDASTVCGVRGAGTLRFLLQGNGRLLAAATDAEALRAMDDLELARRTEPEAASVLAWLSSGQRRRFVAGAGREWLDKAVASAREAVARDGSRPEGFRSLGLALVAKKDDAGAQAAFSRACSLNTTDDAGWSRLGSTHNRLGQWDSELTIYQSVIDHRPHCWQPYWWMANACLRRGRIAESIQAYRGMVRHAPEYHKGYSNLGGALVLAGAYAAAIDTLKRSIVLRPTKTAFDNLGTAYFNSGRIQDAVDSYNQAFQFGLAEYDSWVNLGDAYFFLQGRGDQAAEAYTQAIRVGRERAASRAQQGRSYDVMIHANLSTVFPKLAQPESARVYLNLALAADSANTMVQYCAALTLWQLSEKDRAVLWLDKAIQGGYPVAWLKDSPVFHEWNTHAGFRAILSRAAQAP